MPRSHCSLDWITDEVRREVNLPFEVVQKILVSGFLHIADQLNKRTDVVIGPLGTFKVRDDEDGMPKLKFHPTPTFKSRIRVRPEMNKYNVVLDKNKIALAKLSGKCPMCQAKLETLDPPKCPTHGTEPFEEQSEATHE